MGGLVGLVVSRVGEVELFPRVAIMGNSHKISLGGGLAVVVHVTWMKIRLGFCGFVWLSIVGQSRSSGVV